MIWRRNQIEALEGNGNHPVIREAGFIFLGKLLKREASDGQARRNQMKKRNLQKVNEHFESDFNTA